MASAARTTARMGRNRKSQPQDPRGPGRGSGSGRKQKSVVAGRSGKGTRPLGISKQSNPKRQKVPPVTPTIPFSSKHRILLVGEGNLSFTRSIVENHGCGPNVTAAVLESAAELREKYPVAEENIKVIEAKGAKVVYNVDATKMSPWTDGKGKGSKAGVMDRVIFNFPHVGGKSTDVNRQVRYNQELLVKFFKRAMPSLSPKPGSSIIVTLFEGEPYTLWNIRDLGRHSGLQVERSFKFEANAYLGYKHARTLGVVKGKDGKEGAGWRGEERLARSYIFVRKGEGPEPGSGKQRKLESSDDDEEEAEEIRHSDAESEMDEDDDNKGNHQDDLDINQVSD